MAHLYLYRGTFPGSNEKKKMKLEVFEPENIRWVAPRAVGVTTDNDDTTYRQCANALARLRQQITDAGLSHHVINDGTLLLGTTVDLANILIGWAQGAHPLREPTD